MKPLYIFCAICCFMAVLNLPIGYYTFLRILVSLGAILVIYTFLKEKNYLWIVLFSIILILFNPLFPIYLYRKSIWMPLDVLVGILFLFLVFLKKSKPMNKSEKVEVLSKGKIYARDRIISSKNLIKK